MNQTKEKNLGLFMHDVLKYQHDHKFEGDSSELSTDEEIDDFIHLFMEHSASYDHTITSYGLKHCCERAIGHIMRAGDCYSYTSNDRFKAAMKRAWYKSKLSEPGSSNEIYQFRFRPGAMALFKVMGVYGDLQEFKPLNLKH